MTGLAAHLATGTTTICRAWIVRRADGAVFGFTDHDAPLTVDGTNCRASSGFTAGAIETSTGLSVDNTEVSGALSGDAIREDDIKSGLWDSAAITSYRVNWANPTEREIVFRGSLGELSWGGGAFSAELRGLSEELNKTRGRIYQRRCDAVLCDDRCGKVLERRHEATATVIQVDRNQKFIVDMAADREAGWFDRGRLVIADGPRAGLAERIKSDRFVQGRREIATWKSLRIDVRPGDRLLLEAGCDKTMGTCRAKFGNLINFRGFPHIPGEDWLMAYPTRAGRNDGGRR